MRRAAEMQWPPTAGEPYRVEDAMGAYTEIVMPGAYAGARQIDGDRLFIVAEDEWNDEFSVRHIERFAAITA